MSNTQIAHAQAPLEVLTSFLRESGRGPLKEFSGRYGAPMGRHSDTIGGDYTLLLAEPILDASARACGAYDYGGAYWGSGDEVYRVMAPYDYTAYYRASSEAGLLKQLKSDGHDSLKWLVIIPQLCVHTEDDCEELEHA